mgnify:CR=1 FL=1|jgi:chemotaxis protein CheX
MNVDFLNPFLEAAAHVLKAELGVEMDRGPISLAKGSLTSDEVTVLIAVVGQVQGVVFYGMSAQTGLAMVSRIMDQPFEALDSLAQSGIAELGNVISGRAAINLSQAGYQCTISPPTVVLGKGVRITTLDFGRIVVPLGTELGELVVHLAVRNGAPEGEGALQTAEFPELIQPQEGPAGSTADAAN